MSFSWSTLNDLARVIFDKAGSLGNEEACYRTVINRSYLAAHKLSYEYLWENNPLARTLFKQKAEDHGHVINLMAAGNSDCKIITNKLVDLIKYRNQADYKASASDLKNKAESSLVWAKAVTEKIQRLA